MKLTFWVGPDLYLVEVTFPKIAYFNTFQLRSARVYEMSAYNQLGNFSSEFINVSFY